MVCIDQLSPSNSLILEIHLQIDVGVPRGSKMWQVKTVFNKFKIRSLLLVGATSLLATLAVVPTVTAQVAISINPPVCSYGYYDYSPYGCAPSGYYGPGYFYNGIFLGVGPWASWGYGHGWGDHRFNGAGGGRYVAGHRDGGVHAENRGRGRSVSASHTSASHARPSAAHSHAAASHSSPSHGASHAAASHGGASHGSAHAAAGHGGASHGGGDHH